jgi:hypothetical protein
VGSYVADELVNDGQTEVVHNAAAAAATSDADPDATTGSFAERVKMYKMWVVVVLVEHSVFLLRALVQMSIARVPAFINDAREALEMREEADLQINPDEETDDQRALKLQRNFHRLDVDGDGQLTQQEIEQGLSKDAQKLLHEQQQGQQQGQGQGQQQAAPAPAEGQQQQHESSSQQPPPQAGAPELTTYASSSSQQWQQQPPSSDDHHDHQVRT